MELKKVSNKEVKLRIGLSGASGFGKTYSALLLAFGITGNWNKIAIIDTENESSNLYANLGDFNVFPLRQPFSPENYNKAIKACENASMEVIIIDTISPEWKGVGGCLDLHKKSGGRFQDWSKITPKHDSFIQAVQTSPCHVITTVRRRIEYLVESHPTGKLEIKKLGTKEETRNGWEYEMTLNFMLLNEKHLVKATKDRTGLFLNKPEFVINTATGKRLKQWLISMDSEAGPVLTGLKSSKTPIKKLTAD